MAKESNLEAKYTVLRLGVISSNSISSRTTLLIKHLSKKSPESKTAIVCLHAKASVANKLISAVEIAKRELSKDNRKVFQYAELSFDPTNIKSAGSDVVKDKTLGSGDATVDEDEAFEVMGKAEEKRRDVPTLTVYLSMSPIKELRDAYGEQVD